MLSSREWNMDFGLTFKELKFGQESKRNWSINKMMYHFEHWQHGQLKQILTIKTDSVNAAVSELSKKYRGVFRLSV